MSEGKKWKATKKQWKRLGHRARLFRKEPTQAEEMLWQRLRRKQLCGVRFRRQHVIAKFVVDFFCDWRNLVIELDGSVHDTQKEHDQERQEHLEGLGLKVIRFRNEEVLLQIDEVLLEIEKEITK